MTEQKYTGKKIVFITGSLTGGGAERVISILASSCADLGADVSLILLRERPKSYFVSPNVSCFQIKVKKGIFQAIKRIIILRKLLKENQPACIIAFLPIISLYSLVANIGLKNKLIFSERADPNQSIFSKEVRLKDKIAIFIMRDIRLYNFCDWMVFQTPDAQSFYNKIIQEKSSVIVNPLSGKNLPDIYSGKRKKIIVSAGRLTEQKNFSLLIDAFSDFYNSKNEYELIIYGEGPERERLKKYIANKGLSEVIKLPGFSDNLIEQIKDATMYVSSSNYEGISNSMIEALGAGLPVVATDCPVGGSRMFVHTDENGILVPVKDKSSLVNAMRKIASNEKYALRLSKNAVKIRNEVSADSIAKKWLELT